MLPITAPPQIIPDPDDPFLCNIRFSPTPQTTVQTSIRFSVTPLADASPNRIPECIFQTRDCVTGTHYTVVHDNPVVHPDFRYAIFADFIQYAAQTFAASHIASMSPLPQLPYDDYRRVRHSYPKLQFPPPQLLSLAGYLPIDLDNACVVDLHAYDSYRITHHDLATLLAHHELLPRVLCHAPSNLANYVWSERLAYLTRVHIRQGTELDPHVSAISVTLTFRYKHQHPHTPQTRIFTKRLRLPWALQNIGISAVPGKEPSLDQLTTALSNRNLLDINILPDPSVPRTTEPLHRAKATRILEKLEVLDPSINPISIYRNAVQTFIGR